MIFPFSCIKGAPSASASVGDVTGVKTSYSILISFFASSIISGVSAATSASASPTYLVQPPTGIITSQSFTR